MKIIILSTIFVVLIAGISVCSKAPIIEFPEPTDRFVLAELFTEDF